MPHIRDEGGQFDAPIDIVWKFLGKYDHEKSHKEVRNREVKSISPNVVMITEEHRFNGKWIRVRNKITNIPPVGWIMEMEEGPMAGSKFFNIYHPNGEKTDVTIVGDFKSEQIPESQIEPAVRVFFEEKYNEDRAALKAFALKK
jgi:hypothetical protein